MASERCDRCYRQYRWQNDRDFREQRFISTLIYNFRHPALIKECGKEYREQQRLEHPKLPRIKQSPEEKRARQQRWWKKNGRNSNLRKYGLTVVDYENIAAKQNWRCAICGKRCPNGGKHGLFVDHNHLTNHIRGLLCASCNHRLGWIEKKGWVLNAAQYLQRFGEISPVLLSFVSNVGFEEFEE